MALVCVAFAWILVNAAWVAEDAFIIFRTVDNALHGYGLRWNVAERVQSFTSPLWTLLLIIAGAITREYYFTSLVLSLACSLGAMTLMMRQVTSPATSLWLMVAMMNSRAFVDFTTSGLENALGYLLIAAFAVVYCGGRVSSAECRVPSAAGRETGLRAQGSAAGPREVEGAENGKQTSNVQHSTPNVQRRSIRTWALVVERWLLNLRSQTKVQRSSFSVHRSLRWLFMLSLIAALGVCNRMDAALLFAPAAAYAMWEVGRQPGVGWRRALCAVALGGLPFVAWEIFSVIYYGFPFPNTAYAKLHTGIPGRKLLYRGLLYMLDSLERDPVTLGTTAISLVLVLASADRRRVALAAGVVAYIAYTAKVGGDFMSGRFFSVPFCAACVAVAGVPLRGPIAAALAAGVLALGLLAERPTITYNAAFENRNRPRYIADERGYYYQSSGLLPVLRNGGEPQGPWIEDGKRLRAEGRKIVVRDSVGFLGFYAGPGVHIVDRLALCDPLLARMEVPDKEHWRVGHFERRVPEGYIESLRTGQHHIEDPATRKLYDMVVLITRGGVWRRDRLSAILKVNLGSRGDRMAEGDCVCR